MTVSSNSSGSKPLRDSKGRLLPGSRLNPGARERLPESLAKLVRRKSSDGQKLVATLLSIVDGQYSATPRDRLVAIDMLLTRGWGRVPEQVLVDKQEVSIGITSDLSTDAIRSLLALREKLGLPEPGGVSGTGPGGVLLSGGRPAETELSPEPAEAGLDGSPISDTKYIDIDSEE